MKPEIKRKRILSIDPQATLWEGMDGAVIGITEEGVPVYDIHKMELILMQDGMDWETASEWVEYNILSAYVGDRTPIHMWVLPEEETVNDYSKEAEEVNKIAQSFGLTDNNEKAKS